MVARSAPLTAPSALARIGHYTERDHYYFRLRSRRVVASPVAHNSSANDGGMNCVFADGHAKYMRFMSFISISGSTYNVKTYYWEARKGTLTP